MPIAEGDLPPYPVREMLAKPFPERMRLVARTWAAQIQPNSRAILALYWLKYLLVFIGGWAFFCSCSWGTTRLLSCDLSYRGFRNDRPRAEA